MWNFSSTHIYVKLCIIPIKKWTFFKSNIYSVCQDGHISLVKSEKNHRGLVAALKTKTMSCNAEVTYCHVIELWCSYFCQSIEKISRMFVQLLFFSISTNPTLHLITGFNCFVYSISVIVTMLKIMLQTACVQRRGWRHCWSSFYSHFIKISCKYLIRVSASFISLRLLT